VENVALLAGVLSDDVSKLLVIRYGYEQWSGARIRAGRRLGEEAECSRNV
jgi:hypothetical protein